MVSREVAAASLTLTYSNYRREKNTTDWQCREPPCLTNLFPAPFPSAGNPESMKKHATRHARLFPAPSDLRVNLMPFIMGDKNSLPDYLQPYWPLVEACQLGDEEKRKVGYLTITESQVLPGETQRTPGLHIDAPGAVSGINTKSVHVKKTDERTYVSGTRGFHFHGCD